MTALPSCLEHLLAGCSDPLCLCGSFFKRLIFGKGFECVCNYIDAMIVINSDRPSSHRLSVFELFVRHFFTSISGLDFRSVEPSLTLGFRHFIFSDESISDNTVDVKQNSVQTLVVCCVPDLNIDTGIVNFVLR